MRKIRDVLRLKAAGMSKRLIAESVGISRTAAADCIRRAAHAGLAWPLPDDLGDVAVEALLYPPPATTAKVRRPLPDWPTIHRELRRKGVTLQLLWQEHRDAHATGHGYSRFCELYRAWEGRLSPTMRQTHVAGEKLFVDYAGTTMDVIDGTTGEVHGCQIFVATNAQTRATTPAAVALWALVSPVIDQRLSSNLAEPIRLAPHEWQSGTIPWLITAAGEPAALQKLLEHLLQTRFKGLAVKMRTLAPDGRAAIGVLAGVQQNYRTAYRTKSMSFWPKSKNETPAGPPPVTAQVNGLAPAARQSAGPGPQSGPPIGAAVSKLVSASIGDIAVVFSKSPTHRHFAFADLEWLILPAILTEQAYIAELQNTQTGARAPVAAILWASVSDETDQRLRGNVGQKLRLRPDEWKNGTNLWIVDIAGEMTAVAGALKQLATTVFKEKTVNMVIAGGEQGRQIVHLHKLIAQAELAKGAQA